MSSASEILALHKKILPAKYDKRRQPNIIGSDELPFPICITQSQLSWRITCWKAFTPLSRSYLAPAATASTVFLISSTISRSATLPPFAAKTTIKQEKMFFSDTIFFDSVLKRFSYLRPTQNGIPRTFSTSHSLSTRQKKTSSLFLTFFHLLPNLLTLSCK